MNDSCGTVHYVYNIDACSSLNKSIITFLSGYESFKEISILNKDSIKLTDKLSNKIKHNIVILKKSYMPI